MYAAKLGESIAYLLQVGLGGIEASWAGGELGREVKCLFARYLH